MEFQKNISRIEKENNYFLIQHWLKAAIVKRIFMFEQNHKLLSVISLTMRGIAILCLIFFGIFLQTGSETES